VFADSLIATVRRALCDPLPEVRESASKTFDNLHSNIGNRALDEIIPDLLKKLVCVNQLVYCRGLWLECFLNHVEVRLFRMPYTGHCCALQAVAM
jgi:hypothetical protein